MPSSASSPIELEHKGSGVHAAISLVGAQDSPLQIQDGYAVYRGGGPGGSTVFAASRSDGLEDFVLLDSPAPGGELRYRVRLEKARALRQVDQGPLEVLDAHGSPRLRIQPPYVVDAAGARHAAELRVEGCPVDRSARSPWQRELVELDETSCDFVVTYDTALAHPVLVDPAWDVAAFMSRERTHHSATLLFDGTVLVAGGFDEAGAAVAEAEILCPEDSICPGGVTFATTGSLAVPRGAHTESAVANNKVLIAGGRLTRAATTAIVSTEVFNAATGLFGPGPNLSVGRFGHTATVLSSGKALLVGGEDGTGDSTADVYDPNSNTFAAPVALGANIHRRGHMAELLGNGKVLVAGGIGALGVVSTADLFDPISNTFSPTDDMTSPRAWGTASRLDNGSVLIAGGTNGSVYYKTIDIYNPTTSLFIQTNEQMQKQRAFFAAVKLTGQATVLITGGTDGNVIHNDTEVFDGQQLEFVPALSTTMEKPHNFHTATRLQTGKAVVIGGGVEGTPTTPGSGDVQIFSAIQAEILARENGEPCDAPGECRSNHCYVKDDGTAKVCCNETCSDVCSSCFSDDQATPAPGDGICAVVSDDHSVRPQCTGGVELVLKCNSGIIEATGITPCEPYVCGATKCGKVCDDDSGCHKDYYCYFEDENDDVGECVPKLVNAIACTRAAECESRNCVDGVCCDTKCDGQCQACDVESFEGRCSQVPSGPPHGSRPVCFGEDPECRGECGTNPTKCDYDPELECGDSTCSEGHRNYGLCNQTDEGKCSPAETDCDPFLCDDDGVACKAACESVADCIDRAVCRADDSQCVAVSADQCDGDHTVVKLEGGQEDCSPFKCSGTECRETCVTVDDCVSGKVCDANSECIDPPADPPPPEDCAVANGRGGAGRPVGSATIGLVLAGLAIATRRARRKQTEVAR